MAVPVLEQAFGFAERAGGVVVRMPFARPAAVLLGVILLAACSDAPPLYRVGLGATVAGAGGSSATAGSGGAAAADAGTSGDSGESSGGMPSSAGVSGSGGGNASCAPSTAVLAEDGIRNARDLGGIPLSGGRTVKCGLLFRGPPLNLPNGCGNYEELGVRVIVDLRQPGEGLADAACAREDANVIAAPLPIPYQVSPQNYIADLNTLDSMALIFHALGTEAGYPMYFHCTWGRDRTAVVAAVILSALGASREAIMADYNLSALTVGAYPASLEATLDELERRGGVEGYYAELGVTAQELAFLRDYATEP
jgi:hypothetical protein